MDMTAAQALLDLFTGCIALAAVIAAFSALHTWKKEMTGRRRSELAEQVLADFYQFREIIKLVRSSGAWASEAEGREKADDETERVSSQLDCYYIPLRRLSLDANFFAEFEARKYRFRALFGEAAETKINEGILIVSEIQSAARRQMFHIRQTRGQVDPVIERKNMAIIWSDCEENDATESKLDKLVQDVEAICKPAIEGIKQAFLGAIVDPQKSKFSDLWMRGKRSPRRSLGFRPWRSGRPLSPRPGLTTP